MPVLPARLAAGDTIGIIAPASAPPDPKNIDRSVAVLERLGFKAQLAPNVRQRWGFLAGSDRERASDLMKMFADRKVQAIICVRGGYGTARLLPLLDYRPSAPIPKIFLGYSDITSLHCAFLVKSRPRLLPRPDAQLGLRQDGASPTSRCKASSDADCSRPPRAAFETATKRRPSPSCVAASSPGR